MSVATVIVLVVHVIQQLTHGFTAPYEGFDACGFGGWHCSSDGTDFEVSYECSDGQDVRLWVWTARVPQSTTMLSVKNCRRVELHMDCTMGYRPYTLKRFYADNITTLELLRPLRPHVFLHDNDMYSHAPTELVFSDIKELKWYPVNFQAPGGRCRNRGRTLKRLILNNVYVNSWSNSLFKDLTLQSLLLSKVRFGTFTPGSLSVDASIIISDSQIETLEQGSFDYRCSEMTIKRCMFGLIGRGSISVNAKNFSFINNQVHLAESKSFLITTQTVRFVNNTWHKIEKDAFAEVHPKGMCKSDNVYEFRENEIKFMQNGFAPNMKAYKNSSCSFTYVAQNTFTCAQSCEFTEDEDVNPHNFEKITNGFSNLTADNTCKGISDKSIKETMTELAIECGIITTASTTEIATTELDQTDEPSTTEESSTQAVLSESSHPYYITADAHKGLEIAIPLSVAAVLLLSAVTGTAYWVYKKRNENKTKTVATFHQTKGNYDQDNLIDGQDDDEDQDEQGITFQSM